MYYFMSLDDTDVEPSVDPDIIFQPATLPCGRVVRNRLVKAAMYEHLATLFGGPPNRCHFRLYSEWTKHEWGIVLTGNVQVAHDHLTLGRDIVLPPDLSVPQDNDLDPFRRLADSIHGVGSKEPRDSQFELDGNTTLAILQLSHAGRQSANVLGGRKILHPPMAPSSIRMGSSPACKASILEELVNTIMFQKPTEMTEQDIFHVIDRFVYGSVFAHKAGFDGVQLHVAHGYLLSQFLSPKTNQRTDAFSCDKALDLIQTIVVRIRALTPKVFVIGVKLSAADYTSGSPNSNLTEHEQRALQHLITIASWGTVDIVEVSGGDYEAPSFMTSERSQSKSTRQTFFTRFSQQAMKALAVSNPSQPSTRPLILLTGGLRTPALLSKALALKHADLLGIGRAAVRSPDIPTILKSRLLRSQSGGADSDAPFQPEPDPNANHLYPPASWLWKVLLCMKLMGAGAEMAWHILVMRDLAMLPMIEIDKWPSRPNMDYTLGALHCVLMMFLWRLPTSNQQIHDCKT